MLKTLVSTAFIFVISILYSAATDDASQHAADSRIRDGANIGSEQLAADIICLANGITTKITSPSDSDRAAADKIIKLAGKIIGNGRAEQPKQTPKSIWSSMVDFVFGPNAKQATAATSTEGDRIADNTESAKQIACLAIKFLGSDPVDPEILKYKDSCSAGDTAKEQIMKYAGKIIGNG